jgi:hypothetical protein
VSSRSFESDSITWRRELLSSSSDDLDWYCDNQPRWIVVVAADDDTARSVVSSSVVVSVGASVVSGREEDGSSVSASGG